MRALYEDSNWRQFNKEKMAYTLSYDTHTEDNGQREFHFDEKRKKEHEFLMCYLELKSCMNAIIQCEYYFRRYPFKGMPVTHADYLARNCEVFFNKIYEFKERIKKLGKAYKEVSPKKHFDTGKLIKQYDKEFDQELRERNLLNHHTQFSDVTITKLGLIAILEDREIPFPFLDQSYVEYRRVCRIWIKRIQGRTKSVKRYLIAISEHLSEHCEFLNILPANIEQKE